MMIALMFQLVSSVSGKIHGTLKDFGPIGVLPYTPEERIQVAQSVKNMFSVLGNN